MVQRNRRPLVRDEQGAAVLEFALVAVLFLTLIFGAISFGMIFSVKHSLTNAASEGARAALKANPALLEPDKEQIAEDRATAAAQASLGDRAAHLNPVTASIADCANDPTQRCITVTVSYPYSSHPVVPAMPLLNFLPETLTATSVLELS